MKKKWEQKHVWKHDYLENGNQRIILPISFAGNACKSKCKSDLEIKRDGNKTADLILRFTRYTKVGKKIVRVSDALIGKRVKVTIEILGGA